MPPYLSFRAILVLICVALASAGAALWPIDAAWAQDDSDDDGGSDDSGDDDDDDGDGQGRDAGDDDDDGGIRPTGRTPGNAGAARPRSPTRALAPVELSVMAPGEIVALNLSNVDLAVLLARGYSVTEERSLPEIGGISRRLAIPADTTLEAARNEVRALPSGADADFNHFYRTEQSPDPAVCEGPHCASQNLIGWITSASASTCGGDVVIGVIDTGINPVHPAFASARLALHRMTPADYDPSRAVHGTAVLAILIGDPASRSPGLLPNARVIAVDAFHSSNGDERADVFTLAAAIDFLAARNVRILNMSLAGPANTVLERAIDAVSARDVIVVAASGNAGPSAEPAFPAAYPSVIAVTAVDRTGNVYRRAGRGPHLDFAAPGVDVWTAASVSGARPKTGTSFAAPFVTAAAALMLAGRPELSASEVAMQLAADARDLGEPGRDAVYGHGLIQATSSCGR
ncbi:S8 family serine peptidase [Fertoebacter nigrum]|uniref:S8 family serine peptidase n=1 Tax=Fertoeibacter niger TaxID=2656921 RepID=A0A8X8H443_9RHOB|nr:S8 family serine peptidase [Fertoeibacter niger]NUB45962.1 S8 family serine peptidase [Fertoeibacter niger]